MITTASGYKKALQESERDIFGNRTWSQQYANIDYARQKAEAAISRQYGEDIAKAYQAATVQRGAIADTALGEGVKDMLQSDISSALSSAYDKYMSNLQTNTATLQSNIEQSYSEIDKMLEERAEKFAEFDPEHYNYLKYVSEWLEGPGREDAREKFYSNPLWSKFFNIDEQGTATLRSWEDLSRPVYDPQSGEYISFYDNEGNLTRYGKDFYQLVETYYESQMPVDGETLPPSFASYLYSEKPDLYKWINEDNIYGVALNSFAENKNIGAFRQMLGIRSDADTYNFLENFGGLTSQEINDTFGEVFSSLDKLKAGEDFSVNDLDNIYAKMKEDFKTLGLTGDWNEADMKLKELKEQYREAEAALASNNETTKAVDWAGLVTAVVGVALMAFPPTAGFGAALIGGSAATVGATTVSSSIDSFTTKEQIANLKDQFKETYLNALTYAAADIQNRLTESRGAAGGVLGSGLNNGRGPQTLGEYSDNASTSYETFSRNTKATSSKRTDVSIKGLGSGKVAGGDHFDLVVGTGSNAQTFRLKTIPEPIKDDRQTSYLNKYATGKTNTYPKVNTPVVIGKELYLFTSSGWMKVQSSADNVDDAARAFLGKKN